MIYSDQTDPCQLSILVVFSFQFSLTLLCSSSVLLLSPFHSIPCFAIQLLIPCWSPWCQNTFLQRTPITHRFNSLPLLLQILPITHMSNMPTNPSLQPTLENIWKTVACGQVLTHVTKKTSSLCCFFVTFRPCCYTVNNVKSAIQLVTL